MPVRWTASRTNIRRGRRSPVIDKPREAQTSFFGAHLKRTSPSSPTPSSDRAVQAVLAIHTADRAAHLGQDWEALASRVDSRILDIKDGKVRFLTRGEVRARFKSYFEGIRHTHWEDAEVPKVQSSRDGSLVVASFVVRSRYEPADASSERAPTEFTSAWTSTYRRDRRRWLMTSVTSTFQPSQA